MLLQQIVGDASHGVEVCLDNDYLPLAMRQQLQSDQTAEEAPS